MITMGNQIDELTPKERGFLYSKGEEVDRIPFKLSLAETIPNYYGIKMSDYYLNAKYMVQVEENLINEFGIENTGAHIGLRDLGVALGTELCYKPNMISYVVTPFLDDYGKLDHMELVDVHRDGRLPEILEAAKILKDRYGEERNIGVSQAGPLNVAGTLRGTERLLRDFRKNPEQVHKLMQFSTDCIVKCVKDIYTETGCGYSLSEPMASCNLLGKKQFMEFVFPYLSQLISRCKEFMGKTPSLHVCGKTGDRLEELCDTGISSFSVDNCEDMEEVKERIGNRVSIAGNIDPVDIMRNGTTDQVEQAVIESLIKGSDNPEGFALTPGCQVPMGTPPENIHAFINAAKKYGRGARKGQVCRGLYEERVYHR